MWLSDSCLLLSPGSEPHCIGTLSVLSPTVSPVPGSFLVSQEKQLLKVYIHNSNKYKATLSKVYPPWEPITGFSQNPRAEEQFENGPNLSFTNEDAEAQQRVLPRFSQLKNWRNLAPASENSPGTAHSRGWPVWTHQIYANQLLQAGYSPQKHQRVEQQVSEYDLENTGILTILLGVRENKTTFIIILRWNLTFILSFAHKNMVEFSRRYMTCEDIITNGMFLRSCVLKCLSINF